MGELRKDYFTDRIAIITKDATKRPIDLKIKEEIGKECPYCPNHETMTLPAELVLVQREGTLIKLTDAEGGIIKDWCVRVFPDKFPIVAPDVAIAYGDEPLYREPAHGYHYIIVATPRHDEFFSKMSLDQWVNVLSVVQDRVRWLYSQKSVSYVSVFANHGKETGALIGHPHLQIITLPRLPPLIEQEASKVQKSMRESGICPMCNVIHVESGGPRQILATDHFIAFSPWAPSHAFEYWIFPKKHQTSIIRITQKEIKDLALILRSTLGGLSNALNEPPFSMIFHISSEKKTTRQLHWHIEVYPRLKRWNGFEIGSNIYINQFSPEQAAELLGSASRKELAKLVGIS
ncbi:MAG: galactose-1-phosphate uridylyltransferase [Nitrososphaerales archaeon]